MPRERDEDRVAEAARLYAGGKTTREIAAQLGADPRTVQRWLGDQAARRGPRRRPDVPDAKILDLIGRGMSFAGAAKLTGMSKTGVRMRYYQLTGRPRPERDR